MKRRGARIDAIEWAKRVAFLLTLWLTLCLIINAIIFFSLNLLSSIGLPLEYPHYGGFVLDVIVATFLVFELYRRTRSIGRTAWVIGGVAFLAGATCVIGLFSTTRDYSTDRYKRIGRVLSHPNEFRSELEKELSKLGFRKAKTEKIVADLIASASNGIDPTTAPYGETIKSKLGPGSFEVSDAVKRSLDRIPASITKEFKPPVRTTSGDCSAKK